MTAIYGRVLKMTKGLQMAALYAFKAVVDSGVTFKKAAFRFHFLVTMEANFMEMFRSIQNELEKPFHDWDSHLMLNVPT